MAAAITRALRRRRTDEGPTLAVGGPTADEGPPAAKAAEWGDTGGHTGPIQAQDGEGVEGL